jgi:hypothetical protein
MYKHATGLAVVLTVLMIVLIILCPSENRESVSSSSSSSIFDAVSSDPILSRAEFDTPPEMTRQEFYNLCYTTGYGKNLSPDPVRVADNPVCFRFVIPSGDSITLIGMARRFYSDVREVERLTGLGGVKLLADLSAQASGIRNVNDIKKGQVIYMFTPSAWGFSIPVSEGSMFSAVCSGKVTFVSGRIIKLF